MGPGKGFPPLSHERHGAQGRGLEAAEEVGHIVVDGLGHAVVQGARGGAERFNAERPAVCLGDAEVDAALDAGDGLEPAVVEDVGGLRGPGGNSALARGDKEAAFAVKMGPGGEQGAGALRGGVVEGAAGLNEIAFDGVDAWR